MSGYIFSTLVCNSSHLIHHSFPPTLHVQPSFVSGKLNTILILCLQEYIINLWEVRKVKLYGKPCSTQPQSQSSAGDLRDGTVVGGQRRGQFGKFNHPERE